MDGQYDSRKIDNDLWPTFYVYSRHYAIFELNEKHET